MVGQPVRGQCWAWVWLWKSRVGVRGWTLTGSLFASRSGLFYNQLLKVEGPYALYSGVFPQLPQLAPPARPVRPHRPPPPLSPVASPCYSPNNPPLSNPHTADLAFTLKLARSPMLWTIREGSSSPSPLWTHSAHLAFEGGPTCLLKTKAHPGLTLSQKDPEHHVTPPPRLRQQLRCQEESEAKRC